MTVIRTDDGGEHGGMGMFEITEEDLRRRFRYHPPGSEADVEAHEQVREEILRAAEYVIDFVPPGREQSLAITKLEEAMMWANAGLARSREGREG